MIKVQTLPRIFTYNGLTLPDPNPNFTAEQVREMYVPAYPELATAAIEGPAATDRGMEYTFTRAVGAKG
ncbi:MAG: PRTRC system protein C [Candidatus Dormibacteria bacterium]